MTVELVPREILFGNPDKALGTVSPDGSRIAFLAPLDGVLNVWVGDADGDNARPVTDDRDRGIRAYLWAHDNRHLLYVQDQGGDENWRLYSVDLPTGEVTDLTPFDGVQVQPIRLSPRRPNQMLVGLNRDNPAYHDAYASTSIPERWSSSGPTPALGPPGAAPGSPMTISRFAPPCGPHRITRGTSCACPPERTGKRSRPSTMRTP